MISVYFKIYFNTGGEKIKRIVLKKKMPLTLHQLLILDTFGSGPVCLLTFLFPSHASTFTGLPESFIVPVSGLHVAYSAAVLYNWRHSKMKASDGSLVNARIAFAYNIIAFAISATIALTSLTKASLLGKFVLCSFGAGGGFFVSQLWNYI